MKTRLEEIRIRGVDTFVPAKEIQGRTTIVKGRWLKFAEVMDEELVEGDAVPFPDQFIEDLKISGLGGDIFTFAERPPDTTPRYSFRFEWDNWAVIKLESYDSWWANLPQITRKNVRRAQRRGVEIRTVPFDDELVSGISQIYDESPMRQGRRFWHYGKDFDSVKRINMTYVDRSAFIGAYHGEKLIGFIKVVFVDGVALLMQILTMMAHQDKRTQNALLAYTVGLCVERNCSILVYGQYTYGGKTDSSLAEWKRRNGFQQVDFPRYYIPLNLKGRFAMIIGLHRGVETLIPSWLRKLFLRVRAGVLRLAG